MPTEPGGSTASTHRLRGATLTKSSAATTAPSSQHPGSSASMALTANRGTSLSRTCSAWNRLHARVAASWALFSSSSRLPTKKAAVSSILACSTSALRRLRRLVKFATTGGRARVGLSDAWIRSSLSSPGPSRNARRLWPRLGTELLSTPASATSVGAWRLRLPWRVSVALPALRPALRWTRMHCESSSCAAPSSSSATTARLSLGISALGPSRWRSLGSQ
mmetsp:Transcript_59386/g.138330  ORF Transcript_59386/g.138330 Transcript_59386/m.138330 type:complete len:221 (-) Transcript_59386:274-936(-)